MPPNEIQTAVNDSARSHGMDRRQSSWYMRSPEVVAAINLQKSQYSRKYYVDVGFFFSPGEQFPDVVDAKIQGRAKRCLTDATGIETVFDLDYVMDPTDRTSRIAEVCEELWSLFAEGNSIDGLKVLLDQGRLPRWMLTKVAQARLVIEAA